MMQSKMHIISTTYVVGILNDHYLISVIDPIAMLGHVDAPKYYKLQVATLVTNYAIPNSVDFSIRQYDGSYLPLQKVHLLL